ncbi:MAG: hypothetical protein R3185_00160 [Candidatus Thermoplasmatota archaeon]|nr:hypothetical protein [Candidatus Thermoplasmatota archaeon]
MRASLAWLATTLFIAMLLGAPALHAQTAGQEEQEVSPLTWSLSFDVDEDRISWVNAAANELQREQVEGTFLPDQARLRYQYEREALGPVTEDQDEPRHQFANVTLELSAVYEFQDTNGNQAFDLGDRIVDYHALTNLDRAAFRPAELPGPAEGIVVTYPLEDGGTLEVQIYLSEEPTWVGTRLVYPTDTELNVTIRDRPLVGENTSLALQARAWGDGEIERETRGMQIVGEDQTAYMRWFRYSRVNDTLEEPWLSVLEQKRARGEQVAPGEGILILSTPGEPTVEHGLTVGRFDTRESRVAAVVEQVIKGDSGLYLLGFLGSAVAVGASVAIKLRDQRRTGDGQAGST